MMGEILTYLRRVLPWVLVNWQRTKSTEEEQLRKAVGLASTFVFSILICCLLQVFFLFLKNSDMVNIKNIFSWKISFQYQVVTEKSVVTIKYPVVLRNLSSFINSIYSRFSILVLKRKKQPCKWKTGREIPTLLSGSCGWVWGWQEKTLHLYSYWTSLLIYSTKRIQEFFFFLVSPCLQY